MRPTFRIQRASCLARVDPAKAVAEAEDLVAGDKTTIGMRYNAARVCSLSSAEARGTAERARYAARAVALLRQAGAGGYFKDKARIEELQKEGDFDPLRSREGFQALLAELVAKAESPHP